MSKRAPLAAWLGLAVLVALGLGVVWVAVVAWCESLIDDSLRPDHEYRYVQVLADGTPIVISRPQHDYSAQVWTTLDGKKLSAEDRGRVGFLTADYLPGLGSYYAAPRTLPWSRRFAMFSDRNEPPTYWFFINSGEREGSGYFEGFDSKSKLRVGYLGTAGFRNDLPPPDERFEMDGRAFACRAAVSGAYQSFGDADFTYVFRDHPGAKFPPWAGFMISGSKILRFDLREGASKTILDLPGAFALGATMPASSREQAKDRPAWQPRPIYLTIRTADTLVIADPDGRELDRYVIPESLRGESARFYLLPDHTMLATSLQRHEGDSQTELVWFDRSGAVSRRDAVVTMRASILGKPAAEKWVQAAIVPSPIALATLRVVLALSSGAAGREGPASVLTSDLSQAWPALLVVCLVSAGLSLVCYARQRRYAQPGTAMWMAFVFVTGVPGLLGYWFHRRWPVLEPCPACGRVVPRDRQSCADCRADFPRPAEKGIEVFA